MNGGDVEGFEVVPLVFDLRTVDDREPEPPHDAAKLIHRLRERMPPAPFEGRAGQRDVDPADRRSRFRQFGLTRVERRLDAGLHLVELLADDGAFFGRNLPQQLLQVLQPAFLLAEKLDADGFDPVGIGCAGNRGQCRLLIIGKLRGGVHGGFVSGRARMTGG